jgi:hypothetical protein
VVFNPHLKHTREEFMKLLIRINNMAVVKTKGFRMPWLLQFCNAGF